jgi:hypothetical protein
MSNIAENQPSSFHPAGISFNPSARCRPSASHPAGWVENIGWVNHLFYLNFTTIWQRYFAVILRPSAQQLENDCQWRLFLKETDGSDKSP